VDGIFQPGSASSPSSNRPVTAEILLDRRRGAARSAEATGDRLQAGTGGTSGMRAIPLARKGKGVYLGEASLLHGGEHEATDLCRGLGNDGTGPLQRLDLVAGGALATGDDCAGVAHAAARGRGAAGDKADDRLGVLARLVVLLEELGSVLLHRAANLANDDDTLGPGVVEEDAEGVDVGRAGEGVTADANDERLAQADVGRLGDGLVVEGAGARDDAWKRKTERAAGQRRPEVTRPTSNKRTYRSCRACGCVRA
jgi:hypothetical protein